MAQKAQKAQKTDSRGGARKRPGFGGGNQFVPAGAGSETADFPSAADDDIPF